MRKTGLTLIIAVLTVVTAFGQVFTEDFNDFTWGDFSWETSTGTPQWTGDGQAQDWTLQEGFINATSYGGKQIKHWAVGGSEGDPTFAGGSGAEAKLDGHLGTDYSTVYERPARFISPIINTTGMTDLFVSFIHTVERYNDAYDGTFTIGLASTSDGGDTWNEIWSEDIQVNDGFEHKKETFTITSSDVGSASFQICFFMTGDPFPVKEWAFDDVEISELPDTDVLVQSIYNKTQHVVGVNFDPAAKFLNLGTKPSVTFDAVYKITEYGTATVVYNKTQSITLDKNENKTIYFPSHSFSSNGKIYIAEVTATVTGDDNPSNNIATKELNTWSKERQQVLVESSTYLTCGSCPYAAMALNQIHEEGILQIAAIEHHTSSSPAEYTNSYAQGRLKYLSSTGAPQTYFDGKNMISGGCGSGGCYGPYVAAINKAMTVKSPIQIDIISSKTNASGVFDVAVTVDKLEDVSKDNLVLTLVLTESHIDEPWGTPLLPTLETVNRRMYPDESGQVIDLMNNSSIVKNFSVDATAYPKENCALIAFVFDYETKVVYQAQIVPLKEETDIIVKINPANNSEYIKIDADLFVSFNSSVVAADGSEVIDPSSYIILKETDENGADVPFTATINSYKTKITINPDSDLKELAYYYFEFKEEVVKNGNDSLNSQMVSKFKTDQVESISNQNNIAFKCYPVPTSNNLKISFQESNSVNATIKIYDLLGKVVLNKQVENTGNGQQVIDLDVSFLKEGIHIVEFSNNEISVIQKISIIQK